MSRAALPLDRQCELLQLPKPVPEYQFAKPRRWRFDWAWPEHLIALEIEGGAFISGRHTRGVGFLKDMEKYNTAAAHGWRVLRYTPGQVQNGLAFEQLEQIFRNLSPV